MPSPSLDTFATLDGSLDTFATRLDSPGGPPVANTTEGDADPDATSEFGYPERHASRVDNGLRTSVPGYEIRGVLGRGGMGVVYKALQIRANRMVALKMILGGGNVGEGQLDRFRIEAESVAALRHPNIIQVYEVGEVSGLPFFSLELLEGGTLAKRLAGTPMPPRDAAEMLATLARALHAAHLAGIVHRDLKPANILFDGDGNLKVVDFGLAKRLDSDDDQTMTGQVMGTPAYMAPEQARGENREVGPLADVYSIGAVLYETITGRPPFKGPSAAETVRMVVFEELVSPSRLQPKLPRDLETICLKCLSKEPARRYASAEEIAEDLDRYLAGEPIRARPTPAWERGVKWARRRPATALSASLGLMIVIGLAIGGEWYVASARNRTRREEARVSAARLEAINDLDASNKEQARGDWTSARLTLSQLMAKLRDEPTMDDLRLRARRGLSEVEQRLSQDASRALDLDRLARFRRSRDEALFRDSQFAEVSGESSQSAARSAAADTIRAFEGDGGVEVQGALGRLPASLSAEQRAEVGAGQYLALLVWSEAIARPLPGEDQVTQALEALRLLERASALRGPTPAYHLRRAACFDRAGDAKSARIEAEKADHLEPSGAFDNLLLGQEWARRRDWERARRHYERALREQPGLFWAHCLLAVADLNTMPPHVAEARAELTTCLLQQPSYPWLYLLRGFAYGQQGQALAMASGRSEKGEALAAEAESRFEDGEADFAEALRLGLDGPLRYLLHVNRGTMRYQRRRYEDAAGEFERAIGLDDRRQVAHLSLALALRQLGRREEAIARLGMASEREPTLAAPYRERALARLDRAGLSQSEAEAALLDLAKSADREPPDSRLAASDHARSGRISLSLARPGDALAAADRALSIAPELAEAHLVRIAALLDLHRDSEVLASCEVAMSRGSSSADLHRLRGLGRAARGDYPGAVEDYTRALTLRPGWREARRDRGWSYLFAGAPALALRDFEAAIRQSPSDPDGLAGRAASRIRIGRTREALADAEESLGRGEPTPRILYNAARVYAQAATQAGLEVSRRGRSALRDAKSYELRAASLLRLALDRTPVGDRDRWLLEIVAPDPTLLNVRRNPSFLKAIEQSATPAR